MRSIFSLSFCFCICLTAAQAGDWKLPEESIALKNAPGADLVKANCLMCHSVEYITTQPPFTRDQWKASVTKMQQKFGAPVAPETVDPLVDFLLSAYGKTK